jgi:mono/diheme cytochrome c family protein
MMLAKHLEYLTTSMIVAFAAMVAVATPNTAVAQVEAPPSGHGVIMHPTSGQVTTGQLQFRQYCSPCHGMDGTGDGPVADTLKKKPANLTLLSQNNGGKFPYDHVYNMISGQEVVASHGTREMPIWGVVFSQSKMPGAPGRTEVQVTQKINVIIAYIESIQICPSGEVRCPSPLAAGYVEDPNVPTCCKPPAQ